MNMEKMHTQGCQLYYSIIVLNYISGLRHIFFMKQEGGPIESPDTHNNNNSKSLYFRLCQLSMLLTGKALLKSFTFFSIGSYSCSISCSGFYFVYPSSKRPAILPYILLKKYIVRENNSILQLIKYLAKFSSQKSIFYSPLSKSYYTSSKCAFLQH